MRTITLEQIIDMGEALRFIREVQPGRVIHGDGYLITNIEGLLSDLAEYGFVVSARVAQPLSAIVKELAATPSDSKVNADQSKRIDEVIEKVYPALMAEARGHLAYIATDKRYPVEKLTGDVWSLFRPGVRDMLPSVTVYDFEEAGKCIAFERPTAGAFHLMRGVEGVLRQYYRAKVRTKRIKSTLWGPLTADLRARKRPPPATILNQLDHIRVSFRNPTQHPDAIYDIQEVQDLLNLSIDAVNRMVVDAPGLKAA